MSEMEITSESIKVAGRLARPVTTARARQDLIARRAFFIFTLLPVALIVVVTIALFVRSWSLVSAYPLADTLFGTTWKPTEGRFGFMPFILGTVWVTVVGIVLSVPLCLLVALYLAEYARSATRAFAKPILDLLAAIPPVVYGVWGLLAVVPFVDKVIMPFAEKYLSAIPFFAVNQPTGFGILSAGMVIAVMISPLIISVVFEVLATVPNDLRQASLAMGATRWQTIRNIVIPQVMPGIIAAVVLGASRALGETIAVLMVVGNVPNMPTSIFDSAYPLPALIANNYGEMMSIPLYDAALLGAALVLLVVIVMFNVAATIVLQRMKRKQWR